MSYSSSSGSSQSSEEIEPPPVEDDEFDRISLSDNRYSTTSTDIDIHSLGDITALDETKKKNKLQICIGIFLKYWFLFGLVFSILFAFLIPGLGIKGGPIKPEYTIKYGLVSIIFFSSGLSIKTSELKKAAKFIKSQIFVQTFCFVLIPLFFFSLAKILELFSFNSAAVTGIIILGCLPTTISSCVVLTKAAGGNDAISLIAATTGNLLGLGITPLLLFIFLGNLATVPVGKIFLSLGTTVILPLILGQIFQFLKPELTKKLKEKIKLSIINNIILLIIIWSTFCETFYSNQDISFLDLIILAILLILSHLLILFTIFHISNIKYFNLDSKDRVAVLFAASQKTLALGIPLINILYENNPNLGIISMPILIYHPSQLLIASILSSVYLNKFINSFQQLPTEL